MGGDGVFLRKNESSLAIATESPKGAGRMAGGNNLGRHLRHGPTFLRRVLERDGQQQQQGPIMPTVAFEQEKSGAGGKKGGWGAGCVSR